MRSAASIRRAPAPGQAIEGEVTGALEEVPAQRTGAKPLAPAAWRDVEAEVEVGEVEIGVATPQHLLTHGVPEWALGQEAPARASVLVDA